MKNKATTPFILKANRSMFPWSPAPDPMKGISNCAKKSI